MAPVEEGFVKPLALESGHSVKEGLHKPSFEQDIQPPAPFKTDKRR